MFRELANMSQAFFDPTARSWRVAARRGGRLNRGRARRARRLLRRVVGAAHVNDLGAEGLQDLLHDGVAFGALAQEPPLTPRRVFGRERFVVRLARRPEHDGDADAAAQYLAANLVQQALALRLLQSVVQVLPLRR